MPDVERLPRGLPARTGIGGRRFGFRPLCAARNHRRIPRLLELGLFGSWYRGYRGGPHRFTLAFKVNKIVLAMVGLLCVMLSYVGDQSGECGDTLGKA